MYDALFNGRASGANCVISFGQRFLKRPLENTTNRALSAIHHHHCPPCFHRLLLLILLLPLRCLHHHLHAS